MKVPSSAAARRRGANTGILELAALARLRGDPAIPGSDAAALLVQGGGRRRAMADDGNQRLEYATGPYGRTTWMVDVDRAGRVAASRQVLNEAAFLELQSTPNVTRDEVLRRLGTPGETRHGGRMGGEVWSWRYPTNDCLWFQLSLDNAGRVTSSGYGVDPRARAETTAVLPPFRLRSAHVSRCRTKLAKRGTPPGVWPRWR